MIANWHGVAAREKQISPRGEAIDLLQAFLECPKKGGEQQFVSTFRVSSAFRISSAFCISVAVAKDQKSAAEMG
jgi:hypothetical protein